jgi:hypothetical protein
MSMSYKAQMQAQRLDCNRPQSKCCTQLKSIVEAFIQFFRRDLKRRMKALQ